MHSQLSDILTAEYQQLKPLQQGEEGSRKELPPLGRFTVTCGFGFGCM